MKTPAESARLEAVSLTVTLLEGMLPDIDDLLLNLRNHHGFLNLPEQLVALFLKEGMPTWCQFYEDRKKMNSLGFTAFFGKDVVAEISQTTAQLSKTEQVEYSNMLRSELVELQTGGFFESMLDISEKEQIEMYLEMPESEKRESLLSLVVFLYSFFTQLFNFVAVMTFGKPMTQLVAEAKNGNDDSFVQSIQVDRTLLFSLPYYKNRLIRGQLGHDPVFWAKLGAAISAKPLGSKIRYAKLMFVFFVLDSDDLLNMSLNELMDICQKLGVYGREFGIEDTESLRKRLQYYRRKTGRQIRL